MGEEKELIPENNLDFLDRNLRISVHLSDEVKANLPIITPDDLATNNERFRFFMGKPTAFNNGVLLNITSIIELPGEPDYYKEKSGQVEVNRTKLMNYAQYIAAIQHSDEIYLGDLHTHPLLRKDADTPSDTDVWENVASYVDEELTSYQPFVFCIAGLSPENDMKYSFYRLVREENETEVYYGVVEVEVL